MRSISFAIYGLLLIFSGQFFSLSAQNYTRQDTLRGTLSPERACFDVHFYNLKVRVNPDKKFIAGSNEIHFSVMDNFDRIQLDLFENMRIQSVQFEKQALDYEREGNAFFVRFPKTMKKGEKGMLKIEYEGQPRVAINAPWDGGFSWAKDKKNRDWIGVSCEGLGASVWWPNKDHLSDEPDSMYIHCEVPEALTCVANGQLMAEKTLKDAYKRFSWKVSYPINNYNVSLNIAHYTHFSETYQSQDGDSMPLDYYVLDYNLDKAKKQFSQTKPMLACYEKYFGKYPFWEDGFAMVETPYLGMEHQGAIAYGNNYQAGYRGYDLSGTGIGMRFDYIIIHEVGHEYWGNSVSCSDHGELWIHESFCTYTEGLYVECLYGKEDAYEYLYGLKRGISNKEPIIGPLGVNSEGSGDMYPKGALMLHTLRNVLDNDQKWFALIKSISEDFKYKNTNTLELVAYINEKLGEDYSYFFNQYLRETQIPTLEYSLKKLGENNYELKYRWKANKDFRMPILVEQLNGKSKYTLLKPSTEWKSRKIQLAKNKLTLKPQSYYIFLDAQ